jgi:hypothetical protein
VSELGEIAHIPSYYCSDNVSIEWNKGYQVLNYICEYWVTTGITANDSSTQVKKFTTCQQDVFAAGLQQACQQVVTMLLFNQVATRLSLTHNLLTNC